MSIILKLQGGPHIVSTTGTIYFITASRIVVHLRFHFRLTRVVVDLPAVRMSHMWALSAKCHIKGSNFIFLLSAFKLPRSRSRDTGCCRYVSSLLLRLTSCRFIAFCTASVYKLKQFRPILFRDVIFDRT